MERLALDSTLRDLVNAVNNQTRVMQGGGVVYGFRIEANESDPSSRVTYLEDAVGMEPAYYDFINNEFVWGSWRDAFFIPRPCMVKYDGTVDYYLDEYDYTKKADGTASDVANIEYGGNAMMEWGQNGKRIYMCIEPSSDRRSANVYIADYKVNENYHDWAFINRQGKEVDHFYTRIYEGSEVTGRDGVTRMRSLSGTMPMHGKNATTEINYALANNPGEDVLWYMSSLDILMLVNMLLFLIGKSTNTQSVFGQGWLRYDKSHPTGEGYYGITPSGVGNDKGMFYGSNNIGASSDIVKVFGMENWWANLWERFAGCICDKGVWKVKYTWGKEDGSSVEGYNTTGDGYLNLGNAPLKLNEAVPEGDSYVNGYIKDMIFDSSGCMLPSAMGDGAGSSTYYTDGCWFNDYQSDRYPRFGGYLHHGSACGAFALSVHNPASTADWSFGSALSLKPLA